MVILPLRHATACASALFPRMMLRTATRDPDFMAWIWCGDLLLRDFRWVLSLWPPYAPHVGQCMWLEFIAMFTCRSPVLSMDKSWKDSAFMALGLCLHHSVSMMWAPHQLNQPFSYFWSAVLMTRPCLLRLSGLFFLVRVTTISFLVFLDSCFNCLIAPSESVTSLKVMEGSESTCNCIHCFYINLHDGWIIL